jgi:hypothetical protein
MRYFSTSSQVLTTVRRQGFYPSKRVAAFLAERLCYVLEEEDPAIRLALGFGFDSGLPTVSARECLAAHRRDSGAGSPLPSDDKSFWGGRLLLAEAFTAAEMRICEQVLDWWQGDDSCDSTAETSAEQAIVRSADRAFVVHNLNAGRSLVIVSRNKENLEAKARLTLDSALGIDTLKAQSCADAVLNRPLPVGSVKPAAIEKSEQDVPYLSDYPSEKRG